MFEELPNEIQSNILSRNILYVSLFINRNIYKLMYNIYILYTPITTKEINDYIKTNPRNFMIINDVFPKRIIYQHYELVTSNMYTINTCKDTIHLFEPPHKIYLNDDTRYYCYNYESNFNEITVDDVTCNNAHIDVFSLYNIYVRRCDSIKNLIKHKVSNTLFISHENNVNFIKYYYEIVNNLLICDCKFDYVDYNNMVDINIARSQIHRLYELLKSAIFQLK